jgi:hypothetical protein
LYATLAASAGDEGTNFLVGGIDSEENGNIHPMILETDQCYGSLLSPTTVPQPHLLTLLRTQIFWFVWREPTIPASEIPSHKFLGIESNC